MLIKRFSALTQIIFMFVFILVLVGLITLFSISMPDCYVTHLDQI